MVGLGEQRRDVYVPEKTAENLRTASAIKIHLQAFDPGLLAGMGNTGETPMIRWAR
jgi:hypothetical protein